ncbi:MAG TPA: hypothetical protein ENK05_00160, partial [Gammaproteobacteria bacterium]|nr:hypothetical protein [Gammaproteobacteria bacterium]
DCVCLCVVDPGVGTERLPVAVLADGRWYVGPDNGLFALVVRRAAEVETFAISWRPSRLSDSFHGRDLFAPVAAMLACGRRPQMREIEPSSLERASWPDDLPRIVYIDGYGNAVTGLRARTVDRQRIFTIGGHRCRFHRTFGEAAAGEVFWYRNSNDLVEIAQSGGSAARALGLELGTPLEGQ